MTCKCRNASHQLRRFGVLFRRSSLFLSRERIVCKREHNTCIRILIVNWKSFIIATLASFITITKRKNGKEKYQIILKPLKQSK
jgi:hypothetical protein